MFIDRFSYCVVAVQFRSCDDLFGRLQVIFAPFLHAPPCNQLHVTNCTIVASQMRYHMELGNKEVNMLCESFYMYHPFSFFL